DAAWRGPPSVSRTCAKRSKHRRIHVMHPVHKNRTGHPWDKPGHDDGEERGLFRQDQAARTLPRNSSTALRSMLDWVSSSRAFASTSDAAWPVAAAAVVTPPIWVEISFDPAATD